MKLTVSQVPQRFWNGGADTSFGTRSGGGFKLASVTEEENLNDSPRPENELIWLMGPISSSADRTMDIVE